MAEFSSLDCYPATPDGHLKFLEWVRDEVHNAAEAKRLQFERAYSNATIESMVRGIQWPEANARAAALLPTLPASAIALVAGVLRQRLTAGTVGRIDELLTPAVRALQDALENCAPSRDSGMGEAPAAADDATPAPAKTSEGEGIGGVDAKTKRGRKVDKATIKRADFAKPLREKGETWPNIYAAYEKKHYRDTDATEDILRRAFDRQYPKLSAKLKNGKATD